MSADPYLAHRAGRARSQKREMKFDRSDRDPLALASPPALCLALFVARSQPRELQNGVGARPPGFRTFGVPPGHRRAPLPSLAHSLALPLSPRFLPWRTPFYTILFYLLLPCRRRRRCRLCSLGASAGAGLLSSSPTPFYKYITRPSGPLPLLILDDPFPSSYHCPIVTLRYTKGGTYVVGAPHLLKHIKCFRPLGSRSLYSTGTCRYVTAELYIIETIQSRGNSNRQ